MKKFLIPSILVIALLFIVIFKPFYGWALRNFFAPKTGANVQLTSRLENEKLKSEIAKLGILQSQIPRSIFGLLPAMIYSRYPFNFKNEILVNAGKNNGVFAGKPVLFGDVLLGKVEKVFDENALVETVFDERFQLSVGIGNGGVKALFKGGSLPKLSLIPLLGSIAESDVVYSTSPDFPYGMPIGEIQSITYSADHLFREASLKFSYDLNEVQAVLIKK